MAAPVSQLNLVTPYPAAKATHNQTSVETLAQGQRCTVLHLFTG